jgi:hypothetical protein
VQSGSWSPDVIDDAASRSIEGHDVRRPSKRERPSSPINCTMVKHPESDIIRNSKKISNALTQCRDNRCRGQSKLSPLDYFLNVMRDGFLPIETRVAAARETLPYSHRKPPRPESSENPTHKCGASLSSPNGDGPASGGICIGNCE